jgi:phosphatidate cytidylyltransferase
MAVAAVLLLPTPYLALLLGIVLLFGAWEWTRLAGVCRFAWRAAFVAVAASCLLLLWQAPIRQEFGALLGAIALLWLGLAVFLFRVRSIEATDDPDPLLLPVGLAVLLGPWMAVVHLHSVLEQGPWLVLFLLILIWTADTAAYFTGRRWGNAKLAPVLSPGKTWVGVFGGLGGSAVCGVVLAWILDLPPVLGLGAVLMCALTAFVSVVGDLYESLLKRRRGLKDSGHLLPGHGGMLDRIDSLTAAAPVFTLGVLWLEGQM